jgi:hypothetical protein
MLAYTAAYHGEKTVRDLAKLALAMPAGTRNLLEMAVDEVARPAFARQFQTAGGSDPWQELSDATVERRNRPSGAGGDTPLIATGKGRDAAVDRARWSVTRTEAAYAGAGWGTPGEYIRHHQEGTDHVPPRPWARLEPDDAARLDAVGLAWLDQRLRGAGW